MITTLVVRHGGTDMKARIGHSSRGIARFVFAIVIAVPLCGCSNHRDIDINSGDLRQRTFFLDLPTVTHVKQSPFSREVRRLNIPAPEARVWKPMTVSTGTRETVEQYAGAIEDCDFLLEYLKSLRVPDEERVTILSRALSNLQKNNLEDTYDLIGEMANRGRMMQGLPPVPKQKRMLWRENGKIIQM